MDRDGLTDEERRLAFAKCLQAAVEAAASHGLAPDDAAKAVAKAALEARRLLSTLPTA